MVASALTPIVGSKAGVAIALAAANVDGNFFTQPFDERIVLLVKNGSGGAIDVTIPVQKTSEQVPGYGPVTLTDMEVAIADGAEAMIGPFPPAFINTSGQVEVEYSGVSSVTVAALSIATGA